MEMGAVDFAGGTVVHINAGVAALVMALMVGRRKDYRAGRPITPHNIPFVFLGTACFGWVGSDSMPEAAWQPTVWRPMRFW